MKKSARSRRTLKITRKPGRRGGSGAHRRRDVDFAEMQRLAQVGSWDWNPRTDRVTWSEELYRITGRDPRGPAVSYRDHGKLYTPESWERLQSAVSEALRSGTAYELELQMLRTDGTTRWIRARGEAELDSSGRVTRLRGTVQDIHERKAIIDDLRQSEEKFRSVFRDAGVGMVVVSLDGRIVAANDALCQLFGYTENEISRKTVESLTHPDDWPAFSDLLTETLNSGTSFKNFLKRCLHASGRIVWTESSASLIRDTDGKPSAFVGEVLDVTDRKLAEEALSGVNRRLLEMQERERTRIARELHDDISQSLALLKIGLEQISQAPREVNKAARDQIGSLKMQADQILTDVQALSHTLHSSKLEHMGIVAAARSFCQEIAARQALEIAFEHARVPSGLPHEVALCLFRVLQEALHNAAKHSGARKLTVELYGADDEIGLRVSDGGVGFDPKAARNGYGLGLISMRERLRLVEGAISIRSRPNAGTTISARVPLKPKPPS